MGEVGLRLLVSGDAVIDGEAAAAQPLQLREDVPNPVTGLSAGLNLAEGRLIARVIRGLRLKEAVQ